MHLHYLQHAAFENTGKIADWALGRGYTLSGTRLYSGEALPVTDSFDWLVVMGGPMSVNQDKAHPWLTVEKRFINLALEQNKTVIGICLGAQLLASVLGAKVFPNKYREIGWWPVKLTREGAGHPFTQKLPGRFTPFHWHGETCDLPRGAVNLAESEACAHQLFAYGPKALGIQFHLEMTSQGILDLIANCRHELRDDSYIQSPADMTGDNSRVQAGHTILESLLSSLDTDDDR